MMTLKIKILIVCVLILAFIAIVRMVCKKSLELKYALLWLIADICLMIIVLVPHLLDMIASMLGIYSPVNMVFFLGFCFSLAIIFSLTVALSRMSNRVRRLSQCIALYEIENKELKGTKSVGEDKNEEK